MSDLNHIKTYAKENHIPIIKEDTLSFLLSYLEKETQIRDILECGTALGYSAIAMASVRWDMRIDTLEVESEMVELAKKNIEEANLSDRIHVYHIDAAAFETDTIYDFVFVDAAKSQYRRYLEHFYNNTHKDSVFLFDNLSFHGIVEDPSLSHNRSTIQMTKKIKKFKDDLRRDRRFETVFYDDIGDGIALAKRID